MRPHGCRGLGKLTGNLAWDIRGQLSGDTLLQRLGGC